MVVTDDQRSVWFHFGKDLVISVRWGKPVRDESVFFFIIVRFFFVIFV